MNYPIEQLEIDIRDIIVRLAPMRKSKGGDYSGKSTDTLANLRVCGILGVVVRISDKLMRLKSHYMDGELMQNESIEDTWDDLIHYALYGRIYHDQNKSDVHVCACALKPPKVVPWAGNVTMDPISNEVAL